MNVLYVAKEFGRYHFFKSESDRTAFIDSLPEWLHKHVESYEVRFGKVVN